MKKFLLQEWRHYWGVLLALAVINVLFSLLSPYYLTTYNFLNIFDHSAISLVMAVGMVFVLGTGGIDLSIGSTLACSGIIAAQLFKVMPWPVALVIAIAFGIGVGLLNGFIITQFHLQPFIVTLAMLNIVRGLTLVLSGGHPVLGLPEGFLTLISGNSLVSTSIFSSFAIALICLVILWKTTYSRAVRAVGGGEEAAFVCGINIRKIKISVYAISGATAVIASFIYMAKMDSAEPLAGLTTEWMEAIAAPIIGGNSMKGGKCFIVGTIIGVLIFSCIKSGLNMVGINQHFQQIFIGGLTIAAVIVDSVRSSR
jgi:ribose/xylose/arabinose/galactoside ABC-type transport system permease subunit